MDESEYTVRVRRLTAALDVFVDKAGLEELEALEQAMRLARNETFYESCFENAAAVAKQISMLLNAAVEVRRAPSSTPAAAAPTKSILKTGPTTAATAHKPRVTFGIRFSMIKHSDLGAQPAPLGVDTFYPPLRELYLRYVASQVVGTLDETRWNAMDDIVMEVYQVDG
jgi:hypothetical protein